MLPSLLVRSGLIASLLLNACAAEDDPFAAGVRTSDPLIPGDQLTKFQLPPGFTIQLVATEPDINKPMNMAFDATGRLWVTTSREYPWAAPTNRPGGDRLMIFDDFGPDGRARKITEFADGLNIPIGIYPFRNADKKWKAIVWSIPSIWLLEDTDGDGRADKRTPLYGPFDVSRDTHGNQASFRRGFDGWLYATHGYNNDSHVTARDGSHVDLNSGNTYRIRLDGSHIEQHTHGQVNPFGLAWDPWGSLYSSDCHSAPVYQLLAGGYYPSFGKPHDGLGYAPTMIEHAHGSTAIDGLAYVADDLWPAEYQDNVFIGNVMTSRLNRDRIEWTGATPNAVEQADFLTTTDPWFRPVDDCFGPDGALYVADFYNRIIGHYEVPLTHPGRDRERGRIWRILPPLIGAQALRTRALADDLPGLIGELSSGSLNRRLLAANDLVDRFGSSAIPALEKSLSGPVSASFKIQAGAILHRLSASSTVIDQELHDTDPLVRTHGLHQLLGRRSLDARWLDQVRTRLADAHPRVIVAAVEVLGEHPAVANLPPLLDLRHRIPSGDTHLVYAVRKAIRDQLLGAEVMAQTLTKNWSEPDFQVLADVSLAVPSAAAGTLLVRNLARLKVAPGTLTAALQHAARYAPESELPALSSFASTRFGQDILFQLDLFNSVDQGLRQRGVALPEALKLWGSTLVSRLLEQPEPTAGWSNLPNTVAPTANPWDFEERHCADGVIARLISSFPGGEALTGTLRSARFEAPPFLSFWLCGHDGAPDRTAKKQNGVRLRDADSGEVYRTAVPPRSDIAQKISWDLTGWVGHRVYLEVTDADTGSAYAWLALGRLEPTLIPFPTLGLRAGTTHFARAADLAARLGLQETAENFRNRSSQTELDPDVRIAAAKAALSLTPALTVPVLTRILSDPTQPPIIRESFGGLLAEQNLPTAQRAVIAAFRTVATRVQQHWASTLAGNRDGAEAVLAATEQGIASPRLLQLAGLRNKLKTANPHDWEARATRVTRDLPPADEARDQLIAARRQAYQTYAMGETQTKEGQQIFQKNCGICHQIGGVGAIIGPQLDGIGNRGLDRVCEDILDPNRNVDRAFHLTTLMLRDGESVSGLFRREEGEVLVLANGVGQEFALRKAEVKARSEAPVSPMPDNFGDAIAADDFNHLLAYLLRQTGR